jgi:hypothetical protein
MLDFIGMVVTAALMMLVVNTLTIFMDVSRAAKITVTAVIGVWIGLAAAAAEAGWLTISRPVPVVGFFVAVLLTAAALAIFVPGRSRAKIRALITCHVIDRRNPIEHFRHVSRRVCRRQERDTTSRIMQRVRR